MDCSCLKLPGKPTFQSQLPRGVLSGPQVTPGLPPTLWVGGFKQHITHTEIYSLSYKDPILRTIFQLQNVTYDFKKNGIHNLDICSIPSGSLLCCYVLAINAMHFIRFPVFAIFFISLYVSF